RLRQLAAFGDAQGLALDAVQAAGEQGQVGGIAEQGQAAVEEIAQDSCSFTRRSPLYGAGAATLQVRTAWRCRLTGRGGCAERGAGAIPRRRVGYLQMKVAWAVATSLPSCSTFASSTCTLRPPWSTRAWHTTSPASTPRM